MTTEMSVNDEVALIRALAGAHTPAAVAQAAVDALRLKRAELRHGGALWVARPGRSVEHRADARPDALTLVPPTRSRLVTAALEAALRHAEVVARVAALSRQAQRDASVLQHTLAEVALPPELVAAGPAMRAVMHDLVPLVARQDTTVLLRGETGTGKEVVARRIHALSTRAHRPLLTVNCGALPETLVESALFGHERGAFTGAVTRHVGVFERAHGGTLLLDEVAELPPSAQVKLLRVLQEGELTRVGGERTQRVDVRVIAATHRPLEARIAREQFRADLFYRLNVFPIVLPPLRERVEEIGPLAEAFLARRAVKLGRVAPRIEASALKRLQKHGWPGNIRELENVLERSLLLTRGETLALVELGTGRGAAPPRSIVAATRLDDAMRDAIGEALAACEGRIFGPRGAAVRLGVKPTTLQSKMTRLGIQRRTGDFDSGRG